MQSVTRSVVSLLVGMAASVGRLSLDDPVTRFFPSYEPIANLDDRKRAITVRELLTMRTGFNWTENLRFIFDRHQLVVVSTGDNEDARDTAAVDFLFSYFLPSVRD